MAGCGEADNPAELDPIALLESYELEGRRQDPAELVEVELGDEFRVTRRLPDSVDILFVSFQALATVPRDQHSEFTSLLEDGRARVRDAVSRVVQQTPLEQLTGQNVSWLQRELTAAVNQALRTRAVKAVVFSEFSLERG